MGSGAVVVVFESGAFGEPGHIQPMPRPAFSVLRLGQQKVNRPFPGSRGGILFKGHQSLRGRGQAEQVEGSPAEQGAPIGFGIERQSLFAQAGLDEGIDRVRTCRRNFRRGDLGQRLVRPSGERFESL